MSNRRKTIAVLVVTLIGSGPLALGGWGIDNPMDNSTVVQDEDVNGDGSCTSHPTSRHVCFGTNAGPEGWEHSVDSQEVMPGGPYLWSSSFGPDVGSDWDLSPLDGMGMPIGDHRFWVYKVSTRTKDAETTGHMVIAP